MNCLGEATLDAFVAGELAEAALTAVDAHLDECERCRGRVIARVRERPRTRDTALASREQLPSDPLVGATLGGRYRVLRKLGEGGMGAVYEGVHTLIGRPVALKVLHANFAANRDVVRRFQNEARAAATIGHPNILEATDIGQTDDGRPFLVLTLLRGHDLATELAQSGPLSSERVVRLGRTIASALGAAHEKGIVHRDVKPENVFLEDGGGVKVVDFGISKLRDGSESGTSGTAPNVVMGTPNFMSPEQLSDAAGVDGRADVFSLGATLYQLLTGRFPYEGGNLTALLLKMLSGDAVAPSTLREGVPPALDSLLLAMLRPERDERLATMQAVVEALDAIAEARTSRGSVRPGAGNADLRVVTALVASGLRQRMALESLVHAAGGTVVALAGSDVFAAIFGRDTWRGDEVSVAVRIALDTRWRRLAARVTVVPGQVLRTPTLPAGPDVEAPRLGEETMALAARLLDADLPGVSVAASLSRELAGFVCERVTPDVVLVTGERAADAREGVESSPMLGREAELAQLERALEAALEERTAQIVLLSGPPGIGKSRIVRDLVRRVSSRAGVHLVVAHGAPGASRPALLAHGDAPPADAHPSPRISAERLRFAMRGRLLDLAASGPLVVVLEDLQWVDSMSLDVLAEIVAEHEASALLVIGIARPDAKSPPDPFAGENVTHIRLRGLMPSALRALVERLAGASLPTALVAALAERTGSNPLFVEQILGALVDDGSLSRLAATGELPAALPLPPSVEAAVQARLDALPELEREVCRAAAILDRPFASSDLEALGVEGADEAITALVQRGLLMRPPSREPARREARFASSLVAEVARRATPEVARANLHARAVDLLRAIAPDELEAIAHHSEQAGHRTEAAELLARAAVSSAHRGDLSGALRCADRALSLGVPVECAYALHLARAESLVLAGQADAQAGALEAAVLAARTPDETARALSELAVAQLRAGHAQEALETLDAALAAAEASGRADALARVLGRRAVTSLYAGHVDAAERELMRAESLIASRVPELRADLAVWRAQLAGARGDHGARRNAYYAAVALHAERGDVRNAAGAAVNLADAYNRVGAYEEAERALVSAADECERYGLRVLVGYARANLAYARTALGRADEALADIDAAVRVATASGDQRLRLFARLYRARALVVLGELDEAAREASVVVRDAGAMGVGPAAILGEVAMSQAALGCGDVGAALAASARGMALCEAAGGIEEDEAEVFVAHALALRAAGREVEADEVAGRGRARVLAIAARLQDPEWHERFLYDVPANRALVGL